MTMICQPPHKIDRDIWNKQNFIHEVISLGSECVMLQINLSRTISKFKTAN